MLHEIHATLEYFTGETPSVYHTKLQIKIIIQTQCVSSDAMISTRVLLYSGVYVVHCTVASNWPKLKIDVLSIDNCFWLHLYNPRMHMHRNKGVIECEKYQCTREGNIGYEKVYMCTLCQLFREC